MNARALTIFLYLVTLIAGWVLVSTLVGSIHYLRPGPGFDYWVGALPMLQSAFDGPWQWSMLWYEHAGAHRLLVPRLLFLLEWLCGDFRNQWLLGFSWAALLGSAWIMARAVWAEKIFDATARWICLLLITLGLGSAHHLNVMVYSFNQQWTTGLLLCLLSIKAVIDCCSCTDRRQRIVLIAIALLTSTLLALTTFSLPAILLVWLALCWMLRIRWQITVAISALLILACIAYISTLSLMATLTDNKVAIENPALFFIQAVFILIVSSLRYLGSPLAEYSLAAGITLAASALLVFAIAIKKYKHSADINPLLALAVAYAAFAVGMAFSTAIGRLEPHHAINPRFRAFILPFLVFAGILFMYQIQQYKTGLRLTLATTLIALALLVIVPGHFRQLLKFSDEYDLYLPGSIALATGLTDKSVVHESRFAKFQVVDNQQILSYRDFLKKHRRGIYATPFYQQIGTRVRLENNTTAIASGQLSAIHGGGYVWKGTTEVCGADGRVAVADADGNIIGSGMVNRKLKDSGWKIIYEVFLPYCRSGNPVPWLAYVPANIPATADHDLSLYALVFVQNSPRLIARNK
jgi:hypothetical protein